MMTNEITVQEFNFHLDDISKLTDEEIIDIDVNKIVTSIYHSLFCRYNGTKYFLYDYFLVEACKLHKKYTVKQHDKLKKKLKDNPLGSKNLFPQKYIKES